MSDQPYLVLFDADRIKDFVFATGRLKEIRGGSQIVRDATDADALIRALNLDPGQVVFAEGGSGVLKIEGREAAEGLCRRLEWRYCDHTRGATLTAVTEPLDGDFGAVTARAARRLRLAKEDVRRRQQLNQSPFAQPCESCGMQPATEFYTLQPAKLCAACYVKRLRADLLRGDRTGEELLLEDTAWGRQFLASLDVQTAPDWAGAQLPLTLDKLAELSHPNNYLGFLYADGNGLGDALQDQKTEDDYRHFSRRVSVSMQAALWLALQRHFPKPELRHGIKLAPFELIALGGDDVILVTVADQAVPLAITLGRLFQHVNAGLAPLRLEALTREAALEAALEIGRQALDHLVAAPTGEDVFTLSCGVVIAHPGQPIQNLELQARELLKNAKRQFRRQAALDFHVVSTPVLRAMDDIRRDEYRLEEGDGRQSYLTRRPLTLDDAARLLCHVRQFNAGGEGEALPRNKLNALYQALFTGQDAASFEAFFLRSRLNAVQRAKLDAFFKDFGILTDRTAKDDRPLFPWGRNAQGDVFTVFGDLIEIYEFTHGTDVAECQPAGPEQREGGDGAAQG